MSEPYFQYFDYHGETVYIQYNYYCNNDGSLDVVMFTSTSEPYAHITVNVGEGSKTGQNS